MFNFTSVPPLSLYIHMPWCVRKCPYCDFNSHAVRHELPEDAYVDALIGDLESELPMVWGRTVNSVFIGGGTPSLLSPQALDRLLAACRARLNLSPFAEVTLEANPGTVEQARFAGFRDAGVNRLSMGIQSFSDAHLQALGRIHNGMDARRAVEAARAAGFDNFNLDLMFGLPEQTPRQALADINTAVSLRPTHISHYQLTLEPNTLFHQQPPPLPDDEVTWTMQQECQQALADAGYQHYEISAYARAGFQCQHNLNYWQFGDYVGIGAGAHGKITEAANQRILRRWKHRHPKAYLGAAGNYVAGEKVLSRDDAAFEFMLNALRLEDGFPSHLFSERTGLPITAVQRQLQEAEKRGLLRWDVHSIAPTAHGRQFLNDLQALFLPG